MYSNYTNRLTDVIIIKNHLHHYDMELQSFSQITANCNKRIRFFSGTAFQKPQCVFVTVFSTTTSRKTFGVTMNSNPIKKKAVGAANRQLIAVTY